MSNYKQKWLEALEKQKAGIEQRTNESIGTAGDVHRVATDVAVEMRKIASVTGEVTSAAKRIVTTMNDMAVCGGLEFNELEHSIDSKLSSMPLYVALRRVRDILSYSEARISVLSLRLNTLYDEHNRVVLATTKLNDRRESIERLLIESAWVGPSPSPSEIEDFKDASAGDYQRYGLHYEDPDEDWIETSLFKSTTLREPASASEDSDSDVETARRNGHRQAQIVPRSPIQKKNGRAVDL